MSQRSKVRARGSRPLQQESFDLQCFCLRQGSRDWPVHGGFTSAGGDRECGRLFCAQRKSTFPLQPSRGKKSYSDGAVTNEKPTEIYQHAFGFAVSIVRVDAGVLSQKEEIARGRDLPLSGFVNDLASLNGSISQERLFSACAGRPGRHDHRFRHRRR
ncbi:hypothetical protein DPEC_G00321300 [Dallia pectoralis]|uniref:Uncharacterized protein n=1 Tax=Dallia pectoralis TaxID=75939 RepID=A0ACC2FA78_DALPE|nr:hypothetical protein DPEC_G00321300 [Dallia pectoralis]